MAASCDVVTAAFLVGDLLGGGDADLGAAGAGGGGAGPGSGAGGGLERASGHLDALLGQLVQELGAQAGGHQGALLGAALAARGHLVVEDVLEQDDVALHALHLGQAGDHAAAVGHPGDLQDDVEGGGDLLPDGPDRQLEAGHQHHGLQAADGVPGGVGVHGGHGALVAGVHGLEHVEGLGGTTLTHDDAVGPHPQRVLDQIPDGDLAPALGVCGPGLQVDHVRLLQLELGGVLDGDDPLPVGDEAGQHVEVGRLAGAGAAGDQDVERPLHAGVHHRDQVQGPGPEVDEVLGGVGVLGELPDGEHGAVDGQRRDDGVHPGPVGEAGVHHGGGLVHPAAHRGDDLVDDRPVLGVVGERQVGLLDATLALHPDVVVGVAHDLGHGVVGQQRVERPVAQGVGEDLLDEPPPLQRRDGDVLALQDGVERGAHLGLELLGGEALHLGGHLLQHQLAHLALLGVPGGGPVALGGGLALGGGRGGLVGLIRSSGLALLLLGLLEGGELL
jgi:hypothetical protein